MSGRNILSSCYRTRKFIRVLQWRDDHATLPTWRTSKDTPSFFVFSSGTTVCTVGSFVVRCDHVPKRNWPMTNDCSSVQYYVPGDSKSTGRLRVPYDKQVITFSILQSITTPNQPITGRLQDRWICSLGFYLELREPDWDGYSWNARGKSR